MLINFMFYMGILSISSMHITNGYQFIILWPTNYQNEKENLNIEYKEFGENEEPSALDQR